MNTDQILISDRYQFSIDQILNDVRSVRCAEMKPFDQNRAWRDQNRALGELH